MNIFTTDQDPVVAAINLDDLRLNKMIIESASLLANAIAHHGGGSTDLPISKISGKPFKTKAWQNHPSCVWVKAAKPNYVWLLKHMTTMIEELKYRKGTLHSMVDNLPIFQNGINFIPDGQLIAFANCTPYKQIEDPIYAYKMAMAYKWEHDAKIPIWTKRQRPAWYNDSLVLETKNTKGEFEWTGVRLSRKKRG